MCKVNTGQFVTEPKMVHFGHFWFRAYVSYL